MDRNRGPSIAWIMDEYLIVRPAIFTDGVCKADTAGSAAYLVKMSDGLSGYAVSRRDVAPFLVEGVLKNRNTQRSKKVDIAY